MGVLGEGCRMLGAKSAKQARGKDPCPGFGAWEAIMDSDEGRKGCKGLASGSQGVGAHGQDKGESLSMEEEGAPLWAGAAKSEEVTMEVRVAQPESPCVPQLVVCLVGTNTLATCSWVRWHWAGSTTSLSTSPA